MRKMTFERLWSRAIAIGAPLIVLTAPSAASAGLLQNINADSKTVAEKAGVTSGTPKTLPEIIGNFIGAALQLLGVLLVVYIIWAGFLWMTAAGNEDKVKTAKTMIKNAVIGMVLIFAAYAINGFVLTAIGSATGVS